MEDSTNHILGTDPSHEGSTTPVPLSKLRKGEQPAPVLSANERSTTFYKLSAPTRVSQLIQNGFGESP